MRIGIRPGENGRDAPSLATAAIAGLVATYVMDVAGRRIVAPALGRGPAGGLGRWVGYMLQGTFTHDDISKSEPIPHEEEIGTAAHYAIGLVLGAAYALLLRLPDARRSSVSRATAYGTATTVLPWFWMFPARGQGVMGLRDGDLRVPVYALCSHVAYGLGLGLALRLVDRRVRGRRRAALA